LLELIATRPREDIFIKCFDCLHASEF
jgi:hypothetical protein